MTHQTEARLAAYYYPPTAAAKREGRGGHFELHAIEANGARHILAQGLRCSGVREARTLAATHGATPWNF